MSEKKLPNQIDQIRDIVFGSQMDTYEKKFVAFEEDLQKRFNELSDVISCTELDMLEKLSGETSSLGETLNDFKTLYGLDSREAEDRVRKMETRIETLLEGRFQVLKSGMESLRGEITDFQSAVGVQMAAQKKKLETQFDKKLDQVKSSYLSKIDFASTLMEMSLKFSDDEGSDGSSENSSSQDTSFSN